MNTLNKPNNLLLSIEDLERLKDDLDNIFLKKSGFDFHIDEDKNEIVAYEYLTNRLSHIYDFRNKYIRARLIDFKPYAWICDNRDFKDGLKYLFTEKSINVNNFHRLSLRMLKKSGYKSGSKKLRSLTFLQKSILHLNTGFKLRSSKGKDVIKLRKLYRYISGIYLRIWRQEYLIWLVLPYLINLLKNDVSQYQLEVKNRDINGLIDEITSLTKRCRGLIQDLETRTSGVDHAIRHLNMASTSLSRTMPKGIFDKVSDSSKLKIFVAQVTRAFIDNGGISLGDGICSELLPMPKHRISSFIYDEINPRFDSRVDAELKTEMLEAPICVIMNSRGELLQRTLKNRNDFEEICSIEFCSIDYAILEAWTNNESFFGIRRKGLKYNHKNVERFISSLFRVYESLIGIEEKLSLSDGDIKKLIAHEVMANAIEIEIEKRIENGCIVPSKINEEISIMTII